MLSFELSPDMTAEGGASGKIEIRMGEGVIRLVSSRRCSFKSIFSLAASSGHSSGKKKPGWLKRLVQHFGMMQSEEREKAKHKPCSL